MVEAACFDEGAHLIARERRELKGRGARSNGRKEIVSVLGRHDEDEMFRRLLERLEHRVGGLVAGPIHVVDEEYAAAAARRLELRALLQLAHLRNRKLPQRAVRRKTHEIGMGGEQQRIFIALIGWPLLAPGD